MVPLNVERGSNLWTCHTQINNLLRGWFGLTQVPTAFQGWSSLQATKPAIKYRFKYLQKLTDQASFVHQSENHGCLHGTASSTTYTDNSLGLWARRAKVLEAPASAPDSILPSFGCPHNTTYYMHQAHSQKDTTEEWIANHPEIPTRLPRSSIETHHLVKTPSYRPWSRLPDHTWSIWPSSLRPSRNKESSSRNNTRQTLQIHTYNSGWNLSHWLWRAGTLPSSRWRSQRIVHVVVKGLRNYADIRDKTQKSRWGARGSKTSSSEQRESSDFDQDYFRIRDGMRTKRLRRIWWVYLSIIGRAWEYRNMCGYKDQIEWRKDVSRDCLQDSHLFFISARSGIISTIWDEIFVLSKLLPRLLLEYQSLVPREVDCGRESFMLCILRCTSSRGIVAACLLVIRVRRHLLYHEPRYCSWVLPSALASDGVGVRRHSRL